jgi:hypothetical protein
VKQEVKGVGEAEGADLCEAGEICVGEVEAAGEGCW